MSATVSLIQMLAAGVAKSDGTPLASGRCRFYQPNTLTPVTVYADTAAATAITPPLILTAGGTGTAYTQQPTRLIVKDSTDTNTLFDGNVNTDRGESEYIASAAWNGGAETRLQTILDNFTAAWGGSAGYWQYKAYSDAVERNPKDVITEIQVSVKSYGAIGDGATDDTTAIQAAISKVASAGGGIVYFPPGTYRTSSPLAWASPGVQLVGAGPLVSKIQNTGATTGAITVTTYAATLKSLLITHTSVSTGYGITLGGTGTSFLENVTVVSHARATSTASPVFAVNCIFQNDPASTDPALAMTGSGNYIFGGTFNATAGSGMTVSSGTLYVFGASVSAGTIGIDVTGNGSLFAFSVAAFGSTASLRTATTTAAVYQYGCNWLNGTVNDRRTGSPVAYSFAVNSTVTPLPSQTDDVRVIATAAITVTVGPPVATGFGRPWRLFCINNSGGAVTWTFDAIYKTTAAVAPATGNMIILTIAYDSVSAVFREISRSASEAI